MNLALLFAVAAGHAMAQPNLPAVLPKPVSMRVGNGNFVITRDTVLIDTWHTPAAAQFQAMLMRGAGFKLKTANKAGRAGAIEFEHSSGDLMLQDEYLLQADKNGVHIVYSDKGSAEYAMQTLRQLLPVQIEGPKPSTSTKWTVPYVRIEDKPRFSWRGMHLDVSRHFFQPSFIEKYIDYIAMMKMNVFHWHLVDDGGWRLEIGKYPKLTSVGAWRYGITTDWNQGKLRFDPQSGLPKYGGYYSKAQIKEIVKYAADRNINIVPEIEMPGHTMPVFAAYPELMCRNQPAAAQQGQPSSNVYCVGNPDTFKFIQAVLDEVMEMFPSKWIHIGGDEVDKVYWHRCPLCQAKMRAEGLKNEDELQSYFIRQIDKYLASKGRRLIGWDEILEGGLAKGATVMSWRGIDGGIAAAKAGHDVVMSPTSHCYFDFDYRSQSTDHVYTFEPVPAALSQEEAKHVLGGQANVWTEWIPTEARAEYMIWPRMAAMAETLWSPAKGRDLNDYLTRESALFGRLDRLGANYYQPAPRVATSAILFSGKTTVTALPDGNLLSKLRYTTDGSTPNAASKLYKGPIPVSKATTVKFAYLTPGGKTGEVTEVDCIPAVPRSETQMAQGWEIEYYEGHWATVPIFNKLEPIIKGTANKIGFDVRHRNEDFGLHLTGVFKAEKDGVYRFSLSSDDGSWLKIGGAMVVDNDGLHARSAKEGRIWMPEGWHTIEVGYFQAGGAYGLSLAVQRPGDKGLQPADGFVYLEHL